jgi:hypothetical protein
LTILEIVREVLRDKHAGVIRESVRAVAQKLMEAGVIRDGAILESHARTGPTCSELPGRLALRVLEWRERELHALLEPVAACVPFADNPRNQPCG